MPLPQAKVASAVCCLLPGGLKAAYQISNAHVLFVKAPDLRVAYNVRFSSFIQTISKGISPSALVARKGGAAFRVPVFFTAEED